ncbi:ermin-like [Osmerus eperlanus]|uniref:ermin-like n=1 Tax=Osmerus eperlanus TaxID=29151 RepID=UPI002E0F2B64
MMERQESQSPPTTLEGGKTTPQVEVISEMTLADVAPTEEAVERAAALPEDEGDDEVFYEDEDGGGGPPGPPCSLEESQPPQYADTALELERPDIHTWADHPGRRDTTGSAAAMLASEERGPGALGWSLAELQTQPGPGEWRAPGNQEDDMTSARQNPAEEESEELEVLEDQTEDNQQNTSSQDSLSSMSTQSLGRKYGQKNSFNHHTHSRYNTVSYRKIRRGNTQKKINEFESMMMNI